MEGAGYEKSRTGRHTQDFYRSEYFLKVCKQLVRILCRVSINAAPGYYWHPNAISHGSNCVFTLQCKCMLIAEHPASTGWMGDAVFLVKKGP